MKKLNVKKGFSLIELLVVIAIIGVLSAVGITAYTGYTASAKEQAARTQFAQTVSMINAEMAKCSLGSGNYAWKNSGADVGCTTTVDATMAGYIRTYVSDDLGMKNPYDQTMAAGTYVSATAPSSTPATTADAGKISITCASGTCTIKQRVNNEDANDNTIATVLSQDVGGAS